jgi:hypothetical protein
MTLFLVLVEGSTTQVMPRLKTGAQFGFSASREAAAFRDATEAGFEFAEMRSR